MFVAKSANVGSGTGWKIFSSNAGGTIFRIGDGSTNFSITGSTTINDGNWHYVVITFDGSSNRNGMKLYVDGVLDVTGTSAAMSGPISNYQNNLDVTFGARSGGGNNLTGNLDRVTVFAAELVPIEIQALALGI